MALTVLNLKKLLEGRGINLETEKDKAAGHAHAHSRHIIFGRNGEPKSFEMVDVEWEAKDVHEDVTSWLPEIQDQVVAALLDAVPEPGDDAEISPESDGTKKRRGAVVIRLKPLNGNSRLRVTL